MKTPTRSQLLEVALIIGLGALTLTGLFLPGAPKWLRVLAQVIAVLAMALPVLFPASLIVVYFVARNKGLVPRSTVLFAVALTAGEIVISHGEKRAVFRFADIARARVTRDGGWGESKLLEDGVTLFDSRRRSLAKFPLRAAGAEQLLTSLRSVNVVVDEALTQSPSVLD